ncbi:MAG: Mut7-C RNAse domain-containing protein [Desulfobacterales bacterium]|nr:MAG: Mut7-C RNAse domain-containing protein [Desulfobacterales bacterium]
MNFSFATDRTLGKLAKWLRLMGFDTICETDVSSNWFYEHLDETRVLLTRTGKIRQRFAARRLIFIEANDLFEQLAQVVDDLAITFNEIRPFSRCIECNTPIVNIGKETVYGLVPDYVWETHDNFSLCRQCERIFWRGSHTERSMDRIKRLFDEDSPETSHETS